jgi:hypothetical protein
VIETRGFARKNGDGRNADRRLANRRLQPLGHLTVRGFPKDFANSRCQIRLRTGLRARQCAQDGSPRPASLHRSRHYSDRTRSGSSGRSISWPRVAEYRLGPCSGWRSAGSRAECCRGTPAAVRACLHGQRVCGSPPHPIGAPISLASRDTRLPEPSKSSSPTLKRQRTAQRRDPDLRSGSQSGSLLASRSGSLLTSGGVVVGRSEVGVCPWVLAHILCLAFDTRGGLGF